MAHFYITNKPGVGYIVTCMGIDEGGYEQNGFVRNFGDRQSDAIEFRNDCNNGKIDDRRIKLLMNTYTNQPYIYLGKGNLKKQQQ